jgi:hypothetical protein
VRLADQNRVLPQFYAGLEAAGAVGVPEREADALERLCRHIRFRNLQLLHELFAIVELLEGHGIPALPYKGPVLGSTLYDSLGERQFVDLDLLVPDADVVPASRLLVERGYRSTDGFDPEAPRAVLAADCELHFERGDVSTSGILVELHWQALPRQHAFGLDMADHWDRLETVEIAGVELRALSVEDLLLILCIHGGEKHHWLRLQMLCDVARLLARRPVDWDVLRARAGAIGREHTVLVGVALAWILLGAPLPDEIVARALEDPTVRADLALSRGRAFREDCGLPTFAEWRAYLAEIGETTRGRGHALPHDGILRYLRAISTPGWLDRQDLALPPSLAFLYYAYRPLRLFRKHGTRVLRRI